MLPARYTDYKTYIDNSLTSYLSEYFARESNAVLDRVKQASLHACHGGKRIRSILALEFYLIFSGKDKRDIKPDDTITKLCIAIEVLHAYSLVHDDLPAMDNDEYRRGELTTWKKYGETNAILTGDLLNSLSFEILSETNNTDLIKLFGQAVGIKGMIGGQVLDLYYEKHPKELTLENLIEVHNKKTGALIQFSVISGIILANQERKEKISKKQIGVYEEFGKKLGLAFQIKDDMLDEEGTFEETGKSVEGEENKGFVFFMGIEHARKFLQDTIRECTDIIRDLDTEKLNFLVEYIYTRKK